MAKYSSRIAEVADFLTNSAGTAKVTLVIGGKMLSTTLMHPNDWPPPLVNKATKLKAALCKGVRVEKAVEEMTDTAARAYLKQFTQDLVALANEIEQAKTKRRPAAK